MEVTAREAQFISRQHVFVSISSKNEFMVFVTNSFHVRLLVPAPAIISSSCGPFAVDAGLNTPNRSFIRSGVYSPMSSSNSSSVGDRAV